jgi:DNA replication protein DnaC
MALEAVLERAGLSLGPQGLEEVIHLPDLDPKVLAELGELGFLKRRENVLIQGPPGIRKTHLALALGLKAVKGGHKTYFTTLEEMIKRLLRTSASPKAMRVYTGCSLLIIDEVGYLPMGPAEAHLFFQVISARYEKDR